MTALLRLLSCFTPRRHRERGASIAVLDRNIHQLMTAEQHANGLRCSSCTTTFETFWKFRSHACPRRVS
jgi:protein-arginine kinase activator protein McsA